MLSEADSQRVNTEIQKLQQKLLDNESQALALAHLYRSNDLNADAIDLLEGLLKKGSQSSAVYQLLGSTYQQVGLNQLAKERYLSALQLAKAQKNLAGEAMVQTSLGEVNEALDELKEALKLYQAAQGSYQALGDEGKVRELQQKLDDLKGRIS